MAIRVARFNVSFTATSAALRNVFKGVERDSKRLSASLKNTFGGLGALLPFAGLTAGVYGFSRAVRSSLSDLDKLAKLSDRLAIDPASLRSLQIAAELSGTTFERVEKSLVTFQRRIDEATTGMKSAGDAFDRLGIDAAEFKSLRVEQQIAELGKRLSEIDNPAERTRLAFDLLGRSGSELLLTLKPEALRAASDEVKRLGNSLDRQSLARVEQANDAWALLKSTIGALVDEVVINLAPALAEISTRLRSFIPTINEINAAVKDLSAGVAQLTKWTIDLLLIGQKASRMNPIAWPIWDQIDANIEELTRLSEEFGDAAAILAGEADRLRSEAPQRMQEALRDLTTEAQNNPLLIPVEFKADRNALQDFINGFFARSTGNMFSGALANLKANFAQLGASLTDAGGQAGAAFLSAGSSAAFSARMRNVNDARKIVQINQNQLEQQRRQTSILRSLRDAIVNSGRETVVDFVG